MTETVYWIFFADGLLLVALGLLRCYTRRENGGLA